jgi:hypothetical protein
MIRQDKHDRALEAIHRVLVAARFMATRQAPYEDLVAVLDIAEYLPTLFLRKDDQTDHFRDMLADNAKKYEGLNLALEIFDRP